jgi:hypothetical protein
MRHIINHHQAGRSLNTIGKRAFDRRAIFFEPFSPDPTINKAQAAEFLKIPVGTRMNVPMERIISVGGKRVRRGIDNFRRMPRITEAIRTQVKILLKVS